MKRETQIFILEMLVKQRNWLLFFLSISLIVNFILIIFAFKQKRTTVIVPADFSRPFEISNKGVSREYLEMISFNLLQSLNLTPESADAMKKRFLNRVHPSVYGEVKKQLDQLAEEVKTRQIGTVFTLSELITSSLNSLTVEASGYFSTYLGTKQIHQELRRYRLRFLYRGGILSLVEFLEIEEAGKAKEMEETKGIAEKTERARDSYE